MTEQIHNKPPLHVVSGGAALQTPNAEVKPPTLQIASDMELPINTITQSIAIVAQRGSGKTYLSKVVVEEFSKRGLPFVIIDLMGVFWGLRATAGGGPGFPIPIAGGDHGDMPLRVTDGERLARWVCDGEKQPRSIILDISKMKKSDQIHFVTMFGEELYHRNSRPLHVVLDEADFFVPQRGAEGKTMKRLFDVFDAIVRRGRVKGFGITMITQRPAVLHKDVLTQVSALIALRLSAPHDMKAIDSWIKPRATQQDRDMVMRSLPAMPIGSAWVWSPGWLKRLRKVRVRRQETWDSSSTPEFGVEMKVPKKMAKVDHLKILEEIVAASERFDREDETTRQNEESEE
jgi:hypothetical protein